TSAKLGTCGASTRTASASTGTVLAVTPVKPIAPAMASEAAAAASPLPRRETILEMLVIDLGPSCTGCLRNIIAGRDRTPDLTAPFPVDETLLMLRSLVAFQQLVESRALFIRQL